MGFLKELYDSFMEGIHEGEQEWEETEKGGEKQKRIQPISPRDEFLLKLKEIPYEEQFALSIAAPFRAGFFGDWFTVFDDEPNRYDDLYPLHLFAFGREGLMTEKDKKRLKKALKRDFDVKDSASSYQMIEEWWRWEAFENWQKENKEYPVEVHIWRLSALAYAVTSFADVGYISKGDAMPWLNKISARWRLYGDNIKTENPWISFGMFLLIGDDMLEINKGSHGKALEKYIGYLNTKPGSPWILVPFDTLGN